MDNFLCKLEIAGVVCAHPSPLVRTPMISKAQEIVFVMLIYIDMSDNVTYMY